MRKLHGLPGHPDVSTPGIYANTGSLGMGISKAKGMIEANRLLKVQQPIVVMTGDGELQEGQIWESLQGASNKEFSELLVFVDHNKIQSDTWVEKVSPLGNLKNKFEAFGWQYFEIDGHNFEEIHQVIRGKNFNSGPPTVVVANTIKGKGSIILEEFDSQGEFYEFHSGALKESIYQKVLDNLKNLINVDNLMSIKMGEKSPIAGHDFVSEWADTLVELGKNNDQIVVLDADLVKDTGVAKFKKEFPERFIECGIAEQDMVSQAGGLALKGFIPVVHSFASFLSHRAIEQIKVNAFEKKKIIYVGTLAGMFPSGPGHSHQALNDISLFDSIPGVIIFEATSPGLYTKAVEAFLNSDFQIMYIRISTPRVSNTNIFEFNSVTIGRSSKIILKTKDQKNLFVLVGNSSLYFSSEFIDFLSKKKYDLVGLPWHNFINNRDFEKIGKYEKIVIFVNGILSINLIKNFLTLDKKITVIDFAGIPICGQNLEVQAEIIQKINLKL